MKPFESNADAELNAREVATSPAPWPALWRPWYMKLWWGFTIAWNAALFSMDGAGAFPGAWVFTFLFHPFAPLIPFTYQLLSLWRERFLFPWDPEYRDEVAQGHWKGARREPFDDDLVSADLFAAADTLSPSSGVHWIGHPLNPLNQQD